MLNVMTLSLSQEQILSFLLQFQAQLRRSIWSSTQNHVSKSDISIMNLNLFTTQSYFTFQPNNKQMSSMTFTMVECSITLILKSFHSSSFNLLYFTPNLLMIQFSIWSLWTRNSFNFPTVLCVLDDLTFQCLDTLDFRLRKVT